MCILRCICFALAFTGTYYIFYSFLVSKREGWGTFLIFLVSGFVYLFFTVLGGNHLTLEHFNLKWTVIWTSLTLLFLILGDIYKEDKKINDFFGLYIWFTIGIYNSIF
jgi:hypothetical protein